MLVELTVRNLAVIKETRLAFGPGLNVITGETGSGKSLVVDALEFVLGGPTDRGLLRSGAPSASVEAVFSCADAPDARNALADLGVAVDDDEALVAVLRETHREGRTVSRLNGRTVPAGLVRAAGAALVDVHGQGTHFSLLDPRFQLRVLDGFGGLGSRRTAVERAIAEVERLRRALHALATGAREAAQQRDFLAFQLDEIASAALKEGEEAALLQERALLANAESVREACAAAYAALYDGQHNASDLIAEAARVLRRAPDPTGALGTQITALESAAAQVEDAAREVRSLGEGINADPARLAEIEERIELVRRLKRKYGGSEADVAAFAAEARRKLDAIGAAGERGEELERALSSALEHAGALAWELSEARRSAAHALDTAAGAELGEVGLGNAAFHAAVERTAADDGLPAPGTARFAYAPHGIDRVSFLVCINPGEEAKPLAKVASGGELSRAMLALNGALQTSSGVPTLVFDEIDTGIGGRAAEAVGRKLWALSGRSQVLCVTHLPQIAAYADRHFRIDKAVHGERTYAGAQLLGEEQRVAELAAMLGGGSGSLTDAARAMLHGATRAKSTA